MIAAHITKTAKMGSGRARTEQRSLGDSTKGGRTRGILEVRSREARNPNEGRHQELSIIQCVHWRCKREALRLLVAQQMSGASFEGGVRGVVLFPRTCGKFPRSEG